VGERGIGENPTLREKLSPFGFSPREGRISVDSKKYGEIRITKR